MPVFPGDPQPEIREVITLDKDICAVQTIRFTTHIGTHMDAPSHFIANGMTVDQVPLDGLIGKAVIIDFTDKGRNERITREDLSKYDILPGARVLIRTGWDSKFISAGFYEGFPCITLEAAEYLASLNIGLLGMDTPSPSPLDDPDQAIHKVLLGSGIIVLESLKNLNLIAGDECDLIVLPLPLKGFSGSPCRAVAVIDT
jgi:kynurenine formamidase